MTDEMREEFEAWYRTHTAVNEGQEIEITESTIGSYCGKNDKYSYSDIQEAWLSWKASRAAITVKLPNEIHGEEYADGYNSALRAVYAALDNAGVKYE